MTDIFEAVFREHRGFFRDAAVGAAYELGLFEALRDRPPLVTLAARVGASQRRLRPLVDVLVAEGALRRDDDRLADGLRPPRPASLPDSGWGRLAAVLRSDRPLPPEEPTGDAAASYHEHLLQVGAAPARELAAATVTASTRRVLDGGCGAGAYAAACLAAHPDLGVTLVDEAPVLERARRHLRGDAPRVTTVPGDLRAVALPPSHDLALLVNVLHLHGPEANAALVGRATAALAPGGRLVVKDLAVSEDRSGPPAALYFALDMALYTEAGDVHPESAVRAWLAAAGLVDIERLPLATSPASLVLTATRPVGPAPPSTP